MTRVVSIGECMVELRARNDGAYARGFAGDAFNMAAYLKRSAPEIQVQFLTATGGDALSREMRAAWRCEGVADDLAFEVSNAIPGLYMINVDSSGERSFTYWRSASAARHWFEQLSAHVGALAGADLVFISGISLAILPDEQRAPALALLADLRANRTKIAFDPNYRPALWPSKQLARQRLQEAMAIANFILPSQDDIEALGLEPPASSEIVVTQGALGCTIATPTMRTEMRAPQLEKAAIKDTSGAGDSFTGAYLASRLQGAAPTQAAEAALAVAARVVTAAGALVPVSVSHPDQQGQT